MIIVFIRSNETGKKKEKRKKKKKEKEKENETMKRRSEIGVNIKFNKSTRGE